MSEIEKTEWPDINRKGSPGRYAALVEEAMSNPGQALRMYIGTSAHGAYTAVRSAARVRKVDVEVRTSHGYVYVRVPKADAYESKERGS